MTLRLVSVKPAWITVEWVIGETVAHSELRDGVWMIDRKAPGTPGSITARQGERCCSIGMHRIKDGTQMQPEYRRLRKLLFGDEESRKGSKADDVREGVEG